MYKPTFRIRNTDTVYVTQDYICNGHWMLKKERASLKAFDAFKYLPDGRYEQKKPSGGRIPELNALIPKRDNYRLMPTDKPQSVIWGEKHFGQINGYVYEVPTLHEPQDDETTKTIPGFKVGVSIDYVLLMDGAFAFAVNPNAPILLLDGPTLNDELVGIIMPMRCNQ